MSELERLRLSSPCSAAGTRFEERDEGTHCHECDQTVYDLRGMTRKEAERFARARAREGRLCARVRRNRATGELVFKAEVPRRAGAAGALLGLALAACDEGRDPATIEPLHEAAPAVEAAPATPPAPRIAPGVPAVPIVAPAEPGAAAPVAGIGPSATEEAIDPGATAPVEPAAPTSSHTDTSADLDHHRSHRHRHAAVRVEEEDVLGGLEGL